MIDTRQKLTRYAVSLAMVLAVHAAAIAIALHSTRAPLPVELPPAAMMIAMPPLPEPAPAPKPVQPPTPVEEPPLPQVVEAPKPTIALPKPPPKPKPKPPLPKAPLPKPENKPQPPKELPVAKPVEATPAATPAAAAKPTEAAPSLPSNSDAAQSWQADMMRHLAKFKRYPEDARRRGLEGTATLKFVVDANGNVLSFALANSSGNAALDRATLDMIRRAQPLPTPPKDMLIGGQREVTAPFVYRLDKRR